MKQTKIIATLGPASSEFEVIKQLITAGANVFRLNFSHGSAEEHIRLAQKVRQAGLECGTSIGILADLQGPKIRIACFKTGKIQLDAGQTFTLDAALPSHAGDQARVGLDYPELVGDVSEGDILLLDDGRVQLRVIAVVDTRIVTEVTVGGILSNRKGINLLGGGLSAPALTDKDKNDIHTVAQMHADFVAISFPRDAGDIHQARLLLRAAGCQAKIVAKVERAEVVASQTAMDAMILASDIIMVARGDLGVEIGDARLAGIQKQLIKRCRDIGKPVITATQMMESMISNPMPTRAEVMDVANAVLDGTDAIMLSAESAAGEYPVEAVAAMSRIAAGAEDICQDTGAPSITPIRLADQMPMAIAAMLTTAKPDGDTVLVVKTENGEAVDWIARVAGHRPMFAVSENQAVLNRLTMKRGVFPVNAESPACHDTYWLESLLGSHQSTHRFSKALLINLPNLEGREGEADCHLIHATQKAPELALA